jgi:hypothetical protein
MARLDEIKEFIGFLKAIFVTLVVIETSLIAWVFQNYLDAQKDALMLVIVLLVFIACVIGYLFVKILKEIKKLKDL